MQEHVLQPLCERVTSFAGINLYQNNVGFFDSLTKFESIKHQHLDNDTGRNVFTALDAN